MADDIVQELHDWQHIIEESKGGAVVVMLSGQVFGDAADEIERLRLFYDRQLLDLKKQEAELEYLRAENKRLKEARFDLQEDK